MTDAVVYVKNANKSYGHQHVLNDYSMTVTKGSIYGLLGASGCGKTTILNCIVGRSTLHSGEICVLGGKPGTVGSGVPGPSVGYMPQEVALCPEFTVKDAIYFFGKLMGMTEKSIQTRFEELKELLDLPPDNRILRDCSGGQKRRISFASALIQNPKLLILDEPTAGVDPLLRDRIWKFLRDITTKNGITVIITTHYIEETRAADMIGLMRYGKLIAEAPPDTLLHTFRSETLEDVFLILSYKQEKQITDSTATIITTDERDYSNITMSNLNDAGAHQCSREDLFCQMLKPRPSLDEKGLKKQSVLTINKARMMALLDKNWKQFHRNISGWVFILFILPIVCSLIFLVVVGAPIKGLKVALVNDDDVCENISLDGSIVPNEDGSCHMGHLGCLFVKYLHDDPLFSVIPLKSLPDALDGIRNGTYIAGIYLPRNHSIATEERFLLGKNASEEILDLSQVKVHMDMSDYVLGYSIQEKLINIYRKHVDKIFDDCHYQNFINKSLRIETFYGDAETTLTQDMIPGYFLTLISYIATMLTSQIIISERVGGIWDRSAVAGVTVTEIMLSHFLMQFCVMVGQVTEVYVVTFLIYGVSITGSLWLIWMFGILQGICGMCYGFLVSVSSYDNYFLANALISGGFYPMVLICGIFWPMESQPIFLQWVAKSSPFAIPSESFRYVLRKGWDLTSLHVMKGVGMEFLWIFLFTTISIYVLKNKQ